MADFLLADFVQADIHALIRAGYRGFIRYLDYLPNPKVILKPEYDEILAAGACIILNWENRADDMRGGASIGTAHGQEANRQADALGYPKDRPIIYSADWDAQPFEFDAIEQYLRAAAATGRPAGFYSGIHPLEAMLSRGAAVIGWQASAWSSDSHGNIIVSPLAHLFQRLTPTIWPADGSIDEDVVVNGTVDFGQYPYPGSSGTLALGEDMSQADVDEIKRVLYELETEIVKADDQAKDPEGRPINLRWTGGYTLGELRDLATFVKAHASPSSGPTTVSAADIDAIANKVIEKLSAHLAAQTP